MVMRTQIIFIFLPFFIIIGFICNAGTEEQLQQKGLLLQQLERLKNTPNPDALLVQETEDLLHSIEQQEEMLQQPVPHTERRVTAETSDNPELPTPLDNLTILKKEAANFLKDIFQEELVEPRDSITLDAIKLFISTKLASIKIAVEQKKTDIGQDYAQQIDVLLLFCFIQKNIAAKLELLALGNDISTTSSVEKALTRTQIYHIHIQVLNELYNQLSLHWKAICSNQMTIEQLQENLFSNTRITTLIIKELPQELCYTFWAIYIKSIFGYGSKQNVFPSLQRIIRLYHQRKLLACNIYDIIPMLYKNYMKLIQQYDLRYSQYNPTIFLENLSSTIIDFEKKQQELQELQSNDPHQRQEIKIAIEIIHLFLLKLLSIQQEQRTLETWEKTYSKYPAKTPIWIKHQEIMLDQNLTSNCQGDPLLTNYFTQYNKIMALFFSEKEQSPEFLYMLLLTSAQFKSILANQEQSVVEGLVFKPDSNTSLLKKMAHVLSSVTAYLQKTIPTKKGGLVSAILGELANENGQALNLGGTFLDATQQLVGGNVQTVKKIIIHMFNHISPFITTVLITWIFPKFSQEIKNKFSHFFTQQTETPEEKGKDTTQLGEFISNNPDILEELSKLYPDLIQGLTKQAKIAS